MIHYFDTSAFVPLLIDEPGTPRARKLWRDAERLASSRLLSVKASAALAQARRMGRLDTDQLASTLIELELLDACAKLGMATADTNAPDSAKDNGPDQTSDHTS